MTTVQNVPNGMQTVSAGALSDYVCFSTVRRGKEGRDFANDCKLAVVCQGIRSNTWCCPECMCYRTSCKGGVHLLEGSKGCVYRQDLTCK